MKQEIVGIALVVEDYDRAIAWYTEKLDFELVEDTPLGNGKRWVRVAPRGSEHFRLLLAKAASEEQKSRVGNQTGGRVFLFLHTDDVERGYRVWGERGVRFLEKPRQESYGKVVVFEDLYGNKWDLIQPA
jgi:catechol 2,3-dioxygenase-like lactoylglutathione lyase family enzyme